ncbi:MAG TPA: hypothetical protein PK926_11525 [Spirochaetota bacterium]|nr:hypothetical protein [Spirochaetota bacterium]HPI89130.1 hypothetical protein [Spirochaetota bacterium]HPR48884.1 hypothetical protein [Spirochaetota bacterium]
MADPDDPALFKDASFDLGTPAQSEKRKFLDALFSGSGTISLKKIKTAFIQGLYNYKYKIQNFRLLPTKEKIRMIGFLAAVIVLIVLLVYFTFYYQKPARGSGIII